MHPITRKDNIFLEQLSNETVLYDRLHHRAHSLSQTVFTVWQHADGSQSVDQLAAILNQETGASLGRDVVLVSLSELAKAQLLQNPEILGRPQDLPTRRDLGRKMALAGASASLLPFVASILAPTPAMARSSDPSPCTPQTYQSELNTVQTESQPYWSEVVKNTNNSLTDYQQALSNGAAGTTNTLLGNNGAAQTQFQNAESEFNDMLNALGLPPL